jgi:hypothetical protein
VRSGGRIVVDVTRTGAHADDYSLSVGYPDDTTPAEVAGVLRAVVRRLEAEQCAAEGGSSS